MKKSMQRVISAILSIAMLISVLPAAVFADEAGRVAYGSYVNGKWVQDPNADGTITDENSGVTLSKIAVPNPDDPNKYTITLTVETSTTTTTVNPTSAATVLVIDVSGSMDYCAECGGEEIETFLDHIYQAVMNLIVRIITVTGGRTMSLLLRTV